MASSRFEGKVALVTGAGSGIGRAVAIALTREGARVAVCGRHMASLRETAGMTLTRVAHVEPIAMDVRREPDVARAFTRANRRLGAVDVLVACHGVNLLSRVEETSLARWRTVVATNLTGTFLVAREAVRRMVPRGTGRIVIVSSVSGRPGFPKYPGFAAYASSKYALTGLVEVLAAEMEGTGTGIAMICPGGVDTEMFRKTFPGQAAALTPERTAAAILDLADPSTRAPAGIIIDLL